MRHSSAARVAASITTVLGSLLCASAQEAVFKAGVDLVHVTAVVTDGDGRFVPGLTRDDFIVRDNGKPQEIVAFSSERVPISLGILLDVSTSMTDGQLATAREAVNQFIGLLGKDDELFLIEFARTGRILQNWTQDREAFSRALARANQVPLVAVSGQEGVYGQEGNSGTSVFDAVATSLEIAAKGVHQKKTVLLISDGNDTSSRRTAKQVQEAIRASEVLVYALGVDGGRSGVDERALRRLTDETGGRAEVVKGFMNLGQATARLATEFNRQYLIAYAAPTSRDGRWHEIKVEVRKRGATVRARKGYIAP